MNIHMKPGEISLKEAALLGATDSIFFNHTFFPKTARMGTPPMHQDVWEKLDGPYRYVNILMSRGWAKTSVLRMYTGKRIAYNVSRTILFVGPSEKHSRRSLRWMRKQIERNARLIEGFGLRPGTPWTDEEMEIIHGVDEQSIWLVGMGVTGNTRGINIDDYRPDLIVLDDLMNDENAKSKEGREKLIDLVYGSLINSLAPASEAPLGKLVMLNTPQDFNDISQFAIKDPRFTTIRHGCWTKETEDLPREYRKSAWEERVSTEELQAEYRAHVAQNRLSIFIREKECQLIAPENSAFRAEWLQYFGPGEDHAEPEVHQMFCILVIDPVPPPSDAKLQKGIVDGDFEALTVLGRFRGGIYVLETSYNRGHTPEWTVGEFFRLALKWRVRKVIVETVAYQKVLAWLLREAMRIRCKYYMIKEYTDKRNKEQRILDGITNVASNRQLYVRKSQETFIDQYTHFSTVRKIVKDDVIETVAIGCLEMQDLGFNLTNAEGALPDEEDIPTLEYQRGAP